MSVRILFFASLRESLGVSGEQIDLPPGVDHVAGLKAWLSSRGGAWAALTDTRNLRTAINQTLASPDSPVRDGDEIAFFPPVTGG